MEEQKKIDNLNIVGIIEGYENHTLFLRAEEINSKFVYHFSKRLLDILFSMIGLIILIPLFLIIAFAIKVEEKNGPVFFSQIRIGKNGKEFKMYKFRSMCVGAEDKLNELLKSNEVEGAMFKMKNDPRVTKIGKFLRTSSLDELPQLINVLKGDMSLVGPRPPLKREISEYAPRDMQRLLVKPGITGLWQVSGRSSLSFKEMIELDLQYIRNLSLLDDLLILLKTIKVVIKSEEAY